MSKPTNPRPLLLPGETCIARFTIDGDDVAIEFFDDDGRHFIAFDPVEQRQIGRFLAAAEKARAASK